MPILLMACTIVIAASGSAAAVSLSSATVANGQVTVLEIDLHELDPAATDLKARFGQNTIALFQHPVSLPGSIAGWSGFP